MAAPLDSLNKQQLQAVTHTDGPLLIIAGAGTGKTTVVVNRIAHLIEQGLAKPEEILALTFTDKAASEMEERLDILLPLGNYDLWISTFHSFCERILKQHALDIGIPNDFKLLNDVRQWVLVFNNFDKFNLNYYRPLGSPNKFISALVKHFSKCKDEMITPEQYLKYANDMRAQFNGNKQGGKDTENDIVEINRIEEIAKAYETYQQLLLDNEYLDFGDLINYTMRLFEQRPNILKYYQKHFKFIMVDEFQDTNFAQYQLVKMLAGCTDKTNAHNIVVVGDDDQSIYKFRGASVSNILKFKKEFNNVKEVTLIENYRSSQNILDLAYEFIQANNPDRLEPELGINKKLHSNLKDEGVIRVLEGKDLSEELDLVVKKAQELRKTDIGSTWNDFAILIRANSAADSLLPRLESAGITYSFVSNRGLYKKPLIYDIISYMRLLDNYHSSDALFRTMRLPKFALSTRDMAAVTQATYKKTWSLYDALVNIREIANLSDDSYTKAESLIEQLHKHSELASERSIIELFVTIIDDLGIPEGLQTDTLQNFQNRDMLDQFYKRIEDFEDQNDDKTLRNFIHTLDLEMLAGDEGPIKFDPELGPESLRIMTIHSAKGLEFKYVFILNMVDQRFPTRAHKDSIEIPEPLIQDILPQGDFHMQEERRLFYVGLTRAKSHIYLSWAQDYGGAKTKKPSSFLVETKLVPSDKISRATGKVVFTREPANKNAVYKHLPTEFSFTDISLFKNCPLEYKYRSYLKLPMPGSGQLSFGKTIHKVLQLFAEQYQVSPNLPFAVIEQLYESHWIDEWYATKPIKEKYRGMGQEMIRCFYDDTLKTKPNIKYIETSFRLPLGEFWFKGKADRADSTLEGLQVIDYKTGEVPKIKSGVDQLRIYQWAAEEAWHEKVNHLEYWYLKENHRAEVKLASPEEIESLKLNLLATIEEIRHAIEFDEFAIIHEKTKQHSCKYVDLL